MKAYDAFRFLLEFYLIFLFLYQNPEDYQIKNYKYYECYYESWELKRVEVFSFVDIWLWYFEEL